MNCWCIYGGEIVPPTAITGVARKEIVTTAPSYTLVADTPVEQVYSDLQ